MFVVKNPYKKEWKAFSTKEKAEKFLLDCHYEMAEGGWDFITQDCVPYADYIEECIWMEWGEDKPCTETEYILRFYESEDYLFEINEIE